MVGGCQLSVVSYFDHWLEIIANKTPQTQNRQQPTANQQSALKMLTNPFLRQLPTFPEEIKRMRRNRKIQNISHHTLYLLNTRITEFEYMITVPADEVIVLTEGIGFFKAGNVLAKLMAGDQVAVEEEFDGVVDRRTTHAVALRLHVNEK